jgi:hypothetical protein
LAPFTESTKNSINDGRDAKHGAGNSLSFDAYYLDYKYDFISFGREL